MLDNVLKSYRSQSLGGKLSPLHMDNCTFCRVFSRPKAAPRDRNICRPVISSPAQHASVAADCVEKPRTVAYPMGSDSIVFLRIILNPLSYFIPFQSSFSLLF